MSADLQKKITAAVREVVVDERAKQSEISVPAILEFGEFVLRGKVTFGGLSEEVIKDLARMQTEKGE
ncbi:MULTISPECIES: hypothetical protein [unclassified Caballeronia]|uniref:hypothetical protein n=1 Tax=unclassified Caballeronia TaxID=2646786 RepID=UPI00285C7C8F|nr:MULTISPECIES: hypothetical protein [unclassified Caballeronia]MDR5776258.1 hypothetical protein [Caballeronia sp. LZ002]MDR5851698.1 hypothetical protein [Caballeronia sp. LZ003]